MLMSHTSYIPIHEVGVTNFVAQDLFVFLNHLNPIMWWMRGKDHLQEGEFFHYLATSRCPNQKNPHNPYSNIKETTHGHNKK